MKKGVANYRSGDIMAMVAENCVRSPMLRVWIADGLDPCPDCGGGIEITLDDVKNLKKIVELLETHELTGPDRRER